MSDDFGKELSAKLYARVFGVTCGIVLALAVLRGIADPEGKVLGWREGKWR